MRALSATGSVRAAWFLRPGACGILAMTAIAALGWAVPLEAFGSAAERSGREVVESTCIACHGTGAQGAPRIGDAAAWMPLASRGLASLTESALRGIRNMPAHGGNPGLSDIEIARAITYMVNQSGGRWVEPIGETTVVAERSGREIVEARCASCHQTGQDGAPRIGDRAAWIPRLSRGVDFLVRSAIHGHGPMPPRGGMADLTDHEIRSAILYMFNPAGSAPATRPAAAPALQVAPDAYHKIVDGIEVFLGIMSAETIRAQHGKEDPESRMHGGVPRGRGYYHVNVSLFDSKTRAVITDAQLRASVAQPTSGVETKKLEPMTFGNMMSFGNYFRMSGKNPYTITVQIRRPEMSRAVEARFDFKPY